MSDKGNFIDKFLRRIQPSKKTGAIITQENLPDVDSALEVNRQRVAEIAKTLFAELDMRVAEKIDFEGNILETLFKNRPLRHGDTFNKTEIPEPLKPFVSQIEFRYQHYNPTSRGNDLLYEINCHAGGFHPKVEFDTKDGNEVVFQVHTGINGNEFSSVSVSKSQHGKDNGFLGIRTINTYTLNHNHGEPDHPLQIDQRFKSKRSMSVDYGDIDPEGNVSLLDGQRMTIKTTTAFNIHGTFSKDDNAIKWDSDIVNSTPETVINIEKNTLTVTSGGDVFEFPIRTNIYDELNNAVHSKKMLPDTDIN